MNGLSNTKSKKLTILMPTASYRNSLIKSSKTLLNPINTKIQNEL